MPAEDSVDNEPEGEESASDEPTDPTDDTISDWPAEAVPSEPTESDWTPGQLLEYANPRERGEAGQRRSGQRRSSVSRSVGVIAVGLGIGAVGAILVGIVLATLDEEDAALFAFSLGILCTPAAIILGAIGRLNRQGRRAATIGRRIGCGIPLVWLMLLLVGAIASGSAAEMGQILGMLVLVFLVGCLIILIFDAILGAD